MLTKTKIAFAAALVLGSASVALADTEFDANLGNRYPAYNGAVATQGTFSEAPVALRRNAQVHSAPVRLHTAPVRQPRGEVYSAPAQQDFPQQVFPQSPAGIGGF